MPVIRLVLLLGLAGGLFLLVQFNWTPLQLTFLGFQTPALPLALWVLGAIAAGIITSLLLTSLFSLSNYFAVREARAQWRQTSRRSGNQGRSTSTTSEPTPSYTRTAATQPEDSDADWNDWDGYEEPLDRTSVDRKADTRSTVETDPLDDWETESDDDWEEDEPTDAPRDSPSVSARRTDYEVKQEPKTGTRSGSVYSYSYRDPQSSGVGKAEPVVGKPIVDAEYRVIVPPHRSLDDEPSANESPTEAGADDWFEDERDRPDEREGWR